jgi:hypothetical protein
MKKSILAVAVGAAFGALNWLDRQATDKSRSFTFGANFFSTQVTNQKAAPPVRVRVRELHGRVRYALGLWPATNPAPAIADQLFFVRLPKGVAILGHLSRLSWNAGTAACTMTFGDSASTNRHLVATAINAAGNATPSAMPTRRARRTTSRPTRRVTARACQARRTTATCSGSSPVRWWP